MPAALMRVRLSLVIFSVLSLAAFFTVDPFLSWLNKDVHFVSPLVWLLLTASGLIERFGAMVLQLCSLCHTIVWHVANGITSILFMVLAVALFPAFDLAGIAAAMGFACCFKCLTLCAR